jgi:uncharacterized membrane protein (UPF0127 family)
MRFIPGPAQLWIVLFLLAPAILYGFPVPVTDSTAPALRTDGQLEFLCPDSPARAAIHIEIADSSTTRTKGLMGRMLKDDAEGMLFVFEIPEIRNFWMRNTPGSLDMIFVSEDGWVRNIAERTMPLSDQTYSSADPASYVVEVKGGFARRFGIDHRCRIRWQRF